MEGQAVKLIDQPSLPHRFQLVTMETHKDTAKAISTMIVRAGAIGATGALGMAQAALEAPNHTFQSYCISSSNLPIPVPRHKISFMASSVSEKPLLQQDKTFGQDSGRCSQCGGR